jgi:uroporphyrinogen III methyltransferase/synthase
MGAAVDEVAAYQTVQTTEGHHYLIARLQTNRVDMVTFTSSSTVRNFMAMLPQADAADLMRSVTVACIGPITAETAETMGLKVEIVAEDFTIDGLCKAITSHYST